MTSPSLDELQRWAEVSARRLGLTCEVRVYWGFAEGGDGRGGMVPARCMRFGFRQLAHAHITHEARRTGVARICIRRGLSRRTALDTIKHEVAHFAPGGDAHGPTHLQAQARLGVRSARVALVREGKVRCPKHDWLVRKEKSRKVTAAGLVTVASAVCLRCRKVVG